LTKNRIALLFDQTHYVPILKGRNGEYGALQFIPMESRNRITPLLEVPPIPWDFLRQMPAKTIDMHLMKVAQKIARAWGPERALFMDFLWIENARMNNGEHPVRYILRSARARNVCIIPVVGLVRDEHYLIACAEAIQQDHRGVCIRIQREDFVDFADLGQKIQGLLASLQVSIEDADLLIDLRSIVPISGQIDAQRVVGLIARIPDLNRWRTFTMAATSFPENLMGLPPSDCSIVGRLEWDLWHNILRYYPALLRIPTFGDYGISHPEPSEVDPRIMRPSASVRYTVERSWLVLKAKNLRDYGYAQFHDICRELVKRHEYSGRDFSWGDRYIDDCARELVGTGNLTTWRKVGTSHHLVFVLHQLANAFGA